MAFRNRVAGWRRQSPRRASSVCQSHEAGRRRRGPLPVVFPAPVKSPPGEGLSTAATTEAPATIQRLEAAPLLAHRLQPGPSAPSSPRETPGSEGRADLLPDRLRSNSLPVGYPSATSESLPTPTSTPKYAVQPQERPLTVARHVTYSPIWPGGDPSRRPGDNRGWIPSVCNTSPACGRRGLDYSTRAGRR